MTVNRFEARRDANEVIDWHRGVAKRVAEHCVALLEELEQAEKERDDLSGLIDGADFYPDAASAELAALRADARLAKVPALVEALREIAEMDPPVIAVVNGSLATRVRDALAIWGAEQPGPDTTQRLFREHWHGTENGYRNHKCRCQDCRAAKAKAMREYRSRKPEQYEKHLARERARYRSKKSLGN